jgi:branched-chain amino acid transport system substrate-binding protein
LTQIKAANPEGIYVPGYYTEVGTIARQARELGVTVPLMGGDGWDSPKLWEIGGESMNGCYFSNHYSTDDPSPVVQKFVTTYKKKYSQLPDALAALGYDAAKILADAIGRAGSTDGNRVRDALSATKDFQGVTGTITINKDRNAVKPAVILKVENGKYTLVATIKPDSVKL